MIIGNINAYAMMQQQAAKAHTTQKGDEDFKAIFDNAIENKDTEELKDACKKIESYMLGMVFKQVKESILEDDEEALIPKGDYTRTFADTMIDSVTDYLVEAGGIGLADQLYRQMTQIYNLDKISLATNENHNEETTKVELDKMN